jgi:hypothetical protein
VVLRFAAGRLRDVAGKRSTFQSDLAKSALSMHSDYKPVGWAGQALAM